MDSLSARQLPLYGRQSAEDGLPVAFALVDAEDYDELSRLRWGVLHEKGKPTYARHVYRKDRVQRVLLLHRHLLDAPRGLLVDHINHDGLDNRRSNLRLATASENSFNRRLLSTHSTGYKGVRRNRSRYVAQMKFQGEYIYIDTFDDPVRAALAYDHAARTIFGDFAFTNFPADFQPPDDRPRLLSLPAQGVSAGFRIDPRQRERNRHTPKCLPAQDQPSLFEYVNE